MESSHFQRTEPVIGAGLRHSTVALAGLPAGDPLVELLAASGIGRWYWSPGPAIERLRTELLARHGPALALDVQISPPDEWPARPPDLMIGIGGEARPVLDVALAAGCPALLVLPPAGPAPCRTVCIFPGDAPEPLYRWLEQAGEEAPLNAWDWACASYLCAGLARAMLLHNTPYRRDDLEQLWISGVRMLVAGGDHPFDSIWSALAGPGEQAPGMPFHTPASPRGTLLIAGLGSLGSVAATLVHPYAARLLLADPDRVDVYNPVRQAYRITDIGQPKAQALAARLIQAGAGDVHALDQALVSEQQVHAMIEAHQIRAALVATGSTADFAIARALRDHDIPHIVGRCYPRARYWEAIIVDGLRGAALADLRGHVLPGPVPAPTPEQIAAYSDAGALEREPATLIESGWAATWMARLTAQMLAPPGLRERWMLELLASGRTCLVGGVLVEQTPAGPAYGVEVPGAIHAWGRDSIR